MEILPGLALQLTVEIALAGYSMNVLPGITDDFEFIDKVKYKS